MSDEQGWNGPRRHDEAGLGRLLNRIKQLEQQVADLQRGAPLRSAGIRMSPDGLTVNSSLDVQGSLAATGDASFSGDTEIGGRLVVDGDAEISGPNGLTWSDDQGRVRIRAGRGHSELGTGTEVMGIWYQDGSGNNRLQLGEIEN